MTSTMCWHGLLYFQRFDERRDGPANTQWSRRAHSLVRSCRRGARLICHVKADQSTMALRPRSDLEAAIRSRVARVAVGPSTVRGTPRGTAEAARRFLGQLPLLSFRARNREMFIRSLDRETIRLQAALPARGRRWGVARKLLNIYIRDCVYSAHLRSTYSLGADRAVLRGAPRLHHWPRNCAVRRGTALPAWPGSDV